MGNRAKRAQVAQLLKKNGYGTKLYSGRKLKAYGRLQSRELNMLLHILQFKVGDIVSDYSSNFRIAKLPTPRDLRHHYTHYCESRRNCGFSIYGAFQFEYDNGWSSCGCGWHPEAPDTREQMEQRWLSMTEEEVKGLPDDSKSFKIYCWIKAGGHIHDENGILLPEWEGR